MRNKEAENINKLTDFALDSFGIKNPLVKMNKAEYINELINKWIEIYQITDKRTKEAREIRKTVNNLCKLIGLM